MIFIETVVSYSLLKPSTSSKDFVVRYESELVHHFLHLVENDRDLDWVIRSDYFKGGNPSQIGVKIDSRTLDFKTVFSLKPSIPELDWLLANWTSTLPPVLIAPELVPRILEFCRRKRLAAIDLNGSVYVRTKGILIDRTSLPGRHFRFELEPRNVFVGKSARIIRSLLVDRDRVWTQHELVARTKASSGLISRIVKHLINQGFVEKQTSRDFRLNDPLGLLDAWVKADVFSRRVNTARYSILADNLFEIAQHLRRWAEEESVSIAFTQWIAAWIRHPFTEPVIASAYVSRLPDPRILDKFSLRPVNEAGKIWLHVPDDEGVFLETRQKEKLPIVTDAQIYIDLQETGLRGPEQAKALREWPGFCRP